MKTKWRRKDLTGHTISQWQRIGDHFIGFLKNDDHTKDTCVIFYWVKYLGETVFSGRLLMKWRIIRNRQM